MNTKLTALVLTAATALSLTPKSAFASDKEWAAVGGFLGGLIVGTAINDSHHDSYPRRTTTVIVNGRGDRCDDRPEGYWKNVTVRVWVSGCWIEERGRHGNCYRRYVEGHYEFRTDRVWVSFNRHNHLDYDQYGDYDREVGYGYGHRR
ncbi:MAG: hypothetical protein HYV95_15750 [Opitutae bacterium]|nr:hypothetical protein [Opitutae bacterium]